MFESNVNQNEFQLVSNIKRPASPTQSRDPRFNKRPTADNVPPTIELSNRFQILEEDVSQLDNTNLNSSNSSAPTVRKPPPIHIKNVCSYENLIGRLKVIAGTDTFYCKSTLNEVIVYPATPALYRAIVQYLRSEKIVFHTYQLFEEKPMRVVMRGLHHTTPPAAIISALTEQGFEVKNVVNVLSRNKSALPLFFIDLTQNSFNKDIYKLQHLLHSIVQIEEPRQKKTIVQCSRCQTLGHTKSYCNHPARCVRCAGLHLTSDCTKSRDTPATCVLCGKDHPANYKGCTVYKDLQRQRNPSFRYSVLRSTQQSKQPHGQPGMDRSKIPTVDETTFPRLATHNHPQQQSPPPPGMNYNSTNTTTYANTVNGKHNPAGSDQLLNTMNSFINELKNLIFPIITLLTQVTNALCASNAK
jgi:hypothetical protein